MIASLLHTPAAVASWGIDGVKFGAFTEDGTEFNVQMRNTFGSDGLQFIVGSVGTRSSAQVPGPDLAPDYAPIPSSFFVDSSRSCSPEETYPMSMFDPPCWSYAWLRGASKPGPWGFAVPVVADGPDGSDLVFDRWDAPQADTAGRCYTGDAGVVGGGGLNGANGIRVSAVGFRGYVDMLNPDPTKRGDYSAKAIYAPISPDTSPPIVTIRSDLDCQQLAKGAVFIATYTCQDPGLSFPIAESCVGPVADGSPVDTSTVGVHSFTVTGTDAAGNARSKTVHYTVVPATPSIAVADVSVTEGNAGTTAATLTVWLDTPSDSVVTVDYATESGTASTSDYTAVSGTLTFPVGSRSQTASVRVTGESNFENDETFTVQLSNPVNADIGTGRSTVTIMNDDAAPTASIESVTSVTEGNSGTTNLLFHVSLTAPLERLGYNFIWRIVGGTATPDVDYRAFSNNEPLTRGDFTFDADGMAVISVEVNGDTGVESDETVLLQIGTTVVPLPGVPAPIVVTNANSVGTIVNDDGPPPSWFTGFAPPVDAAPTVNSLKAGQAVPIKFSLGSDRGMNIFAAGSPSTQRVSCTTSSPLDALEETSTAGASGLSYDPSTQLYNYTWKTAKSWAGTCRTVTLSFVDGTSKTVNFRLNK